MKLIVPDFKKGVKLQVENQEDLWYLSHVVDKGDIISGKTERKIKLGSGDERNAKVTKKQIFLKIEAEKLEFHKYSDVLRISGKVISENEDVPKGSYHTFDLEEGSVITIEKKEWLSFQRDKLVEASKEAQSKILILVLDRGDANFALLKKYGYENLLELEGDVAKKGLDEVKESNFYAEVLKKLHEYDDRYKLDKVIVASPAFWKEDFVKQVKDEKLKSKIITATCSSSKNAIEEVVKRPELATVLKEDKVAEETKLVDELLAEISKDNKAVYGLKEVKNAAMAGAIEKLLITDALIHKAREENTYDPLDEVMRLVDKNKGHVKIIGSENDAGKKLDGLTGIGAILRYKMNY